MVDEGVPPVRPPDRRFRADGSFLEPLLRKVKGVRGVPPTASRLALVSLPDFGAALGHSTPQSAMLGR